MIAIVKSTIGDLDMACEFFDKAILYQKKKGYPQYRTNDRSRLQEEIQLGRHYKVLLNQQPLGFFSICFSDPIIWREKNKVKAIYLHRIVVNPEMKGNNLFGKILQWAKEVCLDQGIFHIRMDTWDHNPDLIRYYQTYGFEVLEQFTMPYSEELSQNAHGNDVVLMELKLPHNRVDPQAPLTNYRVEFENFHWEPKGPFCRQKEIVHNGRKMRLIEFEKGFEEKEWCEANHFGIVLDGHMTLNFGNRREEYHEGDGIWLEGAVPHKLEILDGRGVKLIVFEDDIPKA